MRMAESFANASAQNGRIETREKSRVVWLTQQAVIPEDYKEARRTGELIPSPHHLGF